MRQNSNEVVIYRSSFLYRLSIWAMGVGAALLVPAVIIGPNQGGRLLMVLFLVAWLVAWWSEGIRPRVELHSDHVLVVTDWKKVRFGYNELRRPVLVRSRGFRLLLAGPHETVEVWPPSLIESHIAESPPTWQLELQADLINRIGA